MICQKQQRCVSQVLVFMYRNMKNRGISTQAYTSVGFSAFCRSKRSTTPTGIRLPPDPVTFTLSHSSFILTFYLAPFNIYYDHHLPTSPPPRREQVAPSAARSPPPGPVPPSWSRRIRRRGSRRAVVVLLICPLLPPQPSPARPPPPPPPPRSRHCRRSRLHDRRVRQSADRHCRRRCRRDRGRRRSPRVGLRGGAEGVEGR